MSCYVLKVTPNYFAIQPRQQPNTDDLVKTLIITRATGSMNESERTPLKNSLFDIFGILGVFKLVTGNYLGLIINANLVGKIQEKPVYQIKQVAFLPFQGNAAQFLHRVKSIDPDSEPSSLSTSPSTSSTLSRRQIKSDKIKNLAERKAIIELWKLLTSGTFYFSYGYDLTNCIQRYNSVDPSIKEPWKKLDKRFWWNEFILSVFIQKELYNWMLPIIQGFVTIRKCTIGTEEIDFILLSRRSKLRAGLRYKKRGLDEQGNCANFVETEHIIQYQGSLMSYIQTRGSIPLYWSQSASQLKSKPILLKTDTDNLTGMNLHFEQQLLHYGNQTVVSLVEKSGREAIVGEAYSKLYQICLHQDKISFIEFDFHEKCKSSKIENIQVLISELESVFQKIMFYWKSPDGFEFIKQTGVFRTNCMDCLDRTNVFQSKVSREVVNQQLTKLGILGSPDPKVTANFDREFNSAWTENGDAISNAYSGTGALKRDLTEFGKRTKVGMMSDGVNSLTRMYKNNFRDSTKQVVIDYLLGNCDADIFVKKHSPRSHGKVTESSIQEKAIAICASSLFPTKESYQGFFVDECLQFGTQNQSFIKRILLITAKEYYICYFDFDNDKLVFHEKITLSSIIGIQAVSFFNGEEGWKISFEADDANVNPVTRTNFHIIKGEVIREGKKKVNCENTKILKCFQDLHKIKLLEGTIIEPVEQDSIASDGTGSEDEEDEIENDQIDQIFKDLHAILLQDLNNEIEELQEKQSQEDSETSGDEFQLIDYK